ncbi:ATP synthase F1 subunit gamma [Vallitalea okinawensis]|uniref:ATP synthase F1 subunit gamma n=1 Tax=Vallitalea okinawensis TaxID=2078660 RepID=UPI000CFB84FB|nr:ATP synthase F1 subunit gamma [Vallitalea okinawensis]
MASVRDIELRIKSVEGTKQITKAMKLVSTVKLQKAKSQVSLTRPYFEKTRETIGAILSTTDDIDMPFQTDREVKKRAYIVITSDRGLAGSYNMGVCKLVSTEIKDKESSVIVAVGKKARDYFKRNDYEILKSYIGYSERPNFRQAKALADEMLKLYEEGVIDEIHLAYTKFESTINQVPMTMKLFPLNMDDFKEYGQEDVTEKMTYEPSPEYVLGQIIPKYVESILYGALVESSASEQGARMTAMDSATNNADDMIDQLTLAKNRARQGSITQELSEIVGGAEALK